MSDYDYAAAIRRRQSEETAVENLRSSGAPDEVAKVQSLSEKLKLPVSVVSGSPEKSRQASEEYDYKKAVRGRPELAQFLRSPEAAALVKDDLENTRNFVDTFVDGFRATGAGLVGMVEKLGRVPQAGFELLSNQPGALGVKTLEESMRSGVRLPQAPDEYFADTPRQADLLTPFAVAAYDTYVKSKKDPVLPKYDPIAFAAQDLRERLDRVESGVDKIRGPQLGAGPAEKAVLGGLESVGNLAGGMVASAVTKNPSYALTSITGVTFGSSYEKGRRKGLTPVEASVYGAIDSRIELVTERIPLKFLLDDLARNAPLRQVFINNLRREIPQEQLATLGQDLNEWAFLNPEKPFTSYLADRPDAAAETLFATVAAVGLQTPIAVTSSRIAERFDSDRERVRKALSGSENLKKSSELLKALKLSTRSPEGTKAFVKQLKEEAGIDSVEITPDDFEKYAQSANLTPEELAQELDIGESFQESQLTGGEVKVPLENLLPSKHADGLNSKARVSRDGMSAEEAETWLQSNESEDIRKSVAQERDKIKTSDSQKVFNQVYEGITSIGRPENEARQLSSLFTGYVQAQAESFHGGDISAAAAELVPMFFGPDATVENIRQRLNQAAADSGQPIDLVSENPQATQRGRALDDNFEKFGSDPVVAALASLTDFDTAYKTPISKKTSLENVLQDYLKPFPMKKLGKLEFKEVKGSELEEAKNKDPELESQRILTISVPVLYPSGRYSGGPEFPVVISKRQNNEVYIDISQHLSGDRGSLVYQAVANWAKNNNYAFVEDPAGLSRKSIFRRPEQMLSAALKFHDPNIMFPGKDMKDPSEVNPEAVPIYGDQGSIKNIRELMSATVKNTEAVVPEISKMRYNMNTGKFENTDGTELSEDQLNVILKRKPVRDRAIGSSTIKRAILIRSLEKELDGRSPAEVRQVVSESLSSAEIGLQQLFYQSEAPQPQYYSQLQVVLGQKLPKKGTGLQFAELIEKSAQSWGFKREEAEFTGLIPWLLDQEETINRTDVVKYLNENGLKIEEIQLENSEEIDEDRLIDAADNELVQLWNDYASSPSGWEHFKQLVADVSPQHLNLVSPYHSLEGIRARVELIKYISGDSGDLDIFMMEEAQDRAMEILDPDSRDDMEADYAEMTLDEARYDYKNRLYQLSGGVISKESFTGGHWSEENVIAHSRTEGRNVRTEMGVDKTLVVLEIQSDWHQKARDLGYVSDLIPSKLAPSQEMQDRIKATQEAMSNEFLEDPAEINRVVNEDFATYEALTKELQSQGMSDKISIIRSSRGYEVLAKYSGGGSISMAVAPTLQQALSRARLSSTPTGQVTDAPFKKTWPEMVFTRLLSAAAREGYDHISWPRTAQQVATIEGWGPLEEKDDKYFVYRGTQNVTSIVNRYLVDLPRIAKKWAKKYNSEVSTVETYGEKGMHTLGSLKITDAMRTALRGPQTLFQGEDRGASYFFNDGKRAIQIFDKADSSTIIHEFGHVWLDAMRKNATREDAPDQVKKDWATIKEWAKKNKFDISDDSISVDAHELFARGTEAYVREGRAPSLELRDAFARFALWLTRIYRDIRGLNVKLNDDVREVFDRLIATQEQIAIAKQAAGYQAMFTTAKDMGISEELFKVYQDLGSKANSEETERLKQQLMKELEREQKARYRVARDRVRKEVEEESLQLPQYKAISWLRTGKLPDGSTIDGAEHAKINAKHVEDLYQDSDPETVTQIKRMRITNRKEGLDPDDVAQLFGFSSGDGMLRAIAAAPTRSDFVRQETERRMKQEHPDLMDNPVGLAEAALAAIHSGDNAAKVMKAELKALRARHRQGSGERRVVREEEREKQKERDYNRRWLEAEENTRKAEQRAERDAALNSDLPLDAVKAIARGIIGQKRIQDLQPGEYLRAERKASNKALERMAMGDFLVAAAEKQRQILNHYLYLEATQARMQADKIRLYATRLTEKATQQRIGLAASDYHEQLNGILEQYEFKKKSNVAITRRSSLLSWVIDQQTNGNDVSIPDSILEDARQINYRQLPVDQLRDVHETLKSIEHLSRLKNRLIKNRKKIEFAEAKEELIGSISSEFLLKKKKPIDEETLTVLEKVSRTRDEWDASLLKAEQLLTWMDGDQIDGPWQTMIFRPIAEAQNKENEMTRDYTAKLTALFQDYLGQDSSRMKQLVEFPEINETMTRSGLIAFALNVGNSGNYQRLRDGYGWTDQQVKSVLSRMSKADWEFTQNVWDLLDSLWPEVAALQKRMTGIEPVKVEAREIQTPYGIFRGGYYPVVYDSDLSSIGEKQADAQADNLFNNLYIKSTTSQGHTKERAAKVVGELKLSLYNIPQHIAGVVHDIAFREPLLQAEKILSDRDIRKEIVQRVGVQYHRGLKTWLRGIANDRNLNRTASRTIDRFLSGLRMNMSVVTLGLRASTMFSQLGGYVQALEEVQASKVVGSIASFYTAPFQMTEFVHGKSPEMKFRSQAIDRDLRDIIRRSLSKKNVQVRVHMMAMKGIAFFDLMTAVPVWHAAYRQGLARNYSDSDAVAYADRTVRLTQSAGGAKDLANVQMGSEATKMFTLFYSYFSALYARLRNVNQIRKTGRENFVNIAYRSFILVVASSIIGELLAGKGPDEDESTAAWMARIVFLFPFASVPILRDLVNSISSGYGVSTPLSGAVRAASQLARNVGGVATGDKEVSDLAEPALDTAGYTFGLPTGQLKITGGYLWDIIDGTESPDDPLEFLDKLLFKQKE